jgi:hypothetical protein
VPLCLWEEALERDCQGHEMVTDNTQSKCFLRLAGMNSSVNLIATDLTLIDWLVLLMCAGRGAQ